MRRLRQGVAVLAAASLTTTLIVVFVHSLHFAYRNPELHVALETAAALVASLAGFLFIGRLSRGAGSNEVLLASGLGLLALSSVLSALVPGLGHTAARTMVWEALITSTLGALLLAAAAFAPRGRLRDGMPATTLAITIILSLTTVALIAVVLAGDGLSLAVRSSASPASAPDLHGGLQLALHVVAAVAYAAATIGFLRRSVRLDDELLAWLAIGSVLACFSRLNYVLYPTRYTDWVYTGDVFRLLFYAALLIGSMREIASYWRSATDIAVLEERRRFARDLHDGLAQEIAYIARNARALTPADAADAERLTGVIRAVERAQLESRRVVAALSTNPAEPLDIALAREAGEVAERFGAKLELDLVPALRLSPSRTECLVRIACEAVTNAARHSDATRIALTLDRSGEHVRMRVRDYGRGFDRTATTGGFGLVSMRERARAAGGRLRVDSSPGRGTTVEVAF